MPKGLVGSRFKRLRFHLINVPARVVTHARQCCVRYFQAATLQLVRHIAGELAVQPNRVRLTRRDIRRTGNA